ncbi:GatB/YqeY domain-containing protein [Paenalcaligenes niemegkensis]|uniref:GatB/YqeY domain-containing protein n=1 Tax=Paenalcaligenes niemegkensis TaxID=2895469 RepID=UPI001EE8262F|nr:GatB/YqeY domain-containing protein [Paenalcaligenes niemegkensis]
MSQTLKATLVDDVKSAMRARESVRLNTLRLLQAAIKTREIEVQRELDDAEILAIIEKQVKQRRESITAFEKAGRTESAAQEQNEIDVLQHYLPEQASEQAVHAAIEAAISQAIEKGITGPAIMGQVMASVRQNLAGRADMAEISKTVKEKLSSK